MPGVARERVQAGGRARAWVESCAALATRAPPADPPFSHAPCLHSCDRCCGSGRRRRRPNRRRRTLSMYESLQFKQCSTVHVCAWVPFYVLYVYLWSCSNGCRATGARPRASWSRNWPLHSLLLADRTSHICAESKSKAANRSACMHHDQNSKHSLGIARHSSKRGTLLVQCCTGSPRFRVRSPDHSTPNFAHHSSIFSI